MSDSTISAMCSATLPLAGEAVPCVQGGINKQAPAAAFGIPIVGRSQPTALAQFQTWIDENTAPPTLRMYIGASWVALYTIDTDGTLSPAGNLALPGDPLLDNDAATKHYVDINRPGLAGVLTFRTLMDCSANPNYPIGQQGDYYIVSHAGKIGGASGIDVTAGDTLFCRVNDTASGDQIAAGGNWTVGQGKIEGAVVGPDSAASGDFALFDGASGALLKDAGLSLDTDTAMAANSDTRIPSQKAVKNSIGGKPLAADTLGQGQGWAWDPFSATFRAGDYDGHNFLVNSAFDVWQETVDYTLGSTVPKTHIADYWKAGAESTNGRLVSKVLSPFSSTFAVKFIRPSGFTDTGRFRLVQQFELPESVFLAGKTVTVSFDFAAGANYSATSGPYVSIYSGTGLNDDIDLRSLGPNFLTGGTSATSASLASQVAPFGSHSRIVSGPLAVAAGATEVAVEIHSGQYFSNAGTDDSFTIGNVKLEIGNVATPYRKRDLAEEFSRCQWRYQKSFPKGVLPWFGYGPGWGQHMFRRLGSGTAAEGVWVPLAARMRDFPVVTLYNTALMNNQVRNETAGADCSSSTVDNISDANFRVTCNGNSGGSVGDWLAFHYVADLRL